MEVFAESSLRLLVILRRLGSICLCARETAATRIAVGTKSLEDCPMLTWSFGWTFVPESSEALSAITSLTFMLIPVPEPVWKTSTVIPAPSFPSITSFEAAAIALSGPGVELALASGSHRPIAALSGRRTRLSL